MYSLLYQLSLPLYVETDEYNSKTKSIGATECSQKGKTSKIVKHVITTGDEGNVKIYFLLESD